MVTSRATGPVKQEMCVLDTPATPQVALPLETGSREEGVQARERHLKPFHPVTPAACLWIYRSEGSESREADFNSETLDPSKALF